MFSTNICHCHAQRRQIEQAYYENGRQNAVEQFGGFGDIGSHHVQQHIHCKYTIAIQIEQNNLECREEDIWE